MAHGMETRELGNSPPQRKKGQTNKKATKVDLWCPVFEWLHDLCQEGTRELGGPNFFPKLPVRANLELRPTLCAAAAWSIASPEARRAEARRALGRRTRCCGMRSCGWRWRKWAWRLERVALFARKGTRSSGWLTCLGGGSKFYCVKIIAPGIDEAP